MHISELISEQQLDELSLAGIGKGIGTVAKGLGKAVGGVQGAWQGAKDVYGQNRDRVAKVAQRNVSRASGLKSTKPVQQPVQGQPTTTNPQTTQNTTQQPPVTNPSEVDQIVQTVSKMDPASKKEVISKIQNQPAAPQPAQGQAVDLDQLKQQSAARQAQGQADQQQAQQQMQQTQQANAATSQKDNDLVAAVKAEKAKPGWQQDKGLIARAAAQGIHENKKKKKKSVMEFHSKFLGQMI